MKDKDDLISAQLDCSSYPPDLPSAHYIIKPQKLVKNAKRQKSSPVANFWALLLCFLVRPDSARVGGSAIGSCWVPIGSLMPRARGRSAIYDIAVDRIPIDASRAWAIRMFPESGNICAN